MKLTLIIALTLLALTSATGCHSETHAEGVSAKQEPTQSASFDIASACEHLKDIKILPRQDIDDPNYKALAHDRAYDALLAAGENAIPCLIRKINDQTMMDDPRQAPKVGKVAVGDVAFFILVDFGKLNLPTFYLSMSKKRMSVTESTDTSDLLTRIITVRNYKRRP